MRTILLFSVATALAACAPQRDPLVGVSSSAPARDAGASGYQGAGTPAVGVSNAAPGLGQQGSSQGYQTSAPGRSNGASVYVPRSTSLRGGDGYQLPARPANTGTPSPSSTQY